MYIKDFVNNFRNHPIIFVGTGLSLRYLKNSYSWDGLLKKIAQDFGKDEEYYLDIKANCIVNESFDYSKVATILEQDFNKTLKENRLGKFKNINDLYYKNMKVGKSISRFKLYISYLLNNLVYKEDVQDEILELKKARKNIGSVITTNYDTMIEDIFSFSPLIGNDILLSNPYGSVYKIHGCVTCPEKIIITENDYIDFNSKYDLIRSQLLSMFIHNPIIFIGYNIGDKNIIDILKTIFSYVDYDSETSKKIRDNFLLVEYEKGSNETKVYEHDIQIEGLSTLRINKISTDNFKEIYEALANLSLPVSAMDIRKVQSVVKDIYAGGDIKVSITEDLDNLKNSDKVLVVGSKNTIRYEFQTISEMMINYFNIIEESNSKLLELINKQRIQKSQYFPIYEFSKICNCIENEKDLKECQKDKIRYVIKNAPDICNKHFESIEEIYSDNEISRTNKSTAIVCSIMNGNIELDSIKTFLMSYENKRTTEYRKILCAYDLKKNIEN